MKQREKGETYRPNVTINKLKGGVPSIITVSGRRYILDHRTNEKEKRRAAFNKNT